MLDKVKSFLRFLVAIPWTIFWILLSAVMYPLQAAARLSVPEKKLVDDLNYKKDDENFRKAIAFIELYDRRLGKYPDSLQDESFQESMGIWDRFLCNSVLYSKTESGYELRLKSKENAQHLKYPSDFWNGLGLLDTNTGGFREDKDINM